MPACTVTVMSKAYDENLADRLDELHNVQQQLAAIEEQWKHWRAKSREISLQLITEDKLPVAEVARLSGHHRNTLNVWLQVFNAETKGAKRSGRGS